MYTLSVKIERGLFNPRPLEHKLEFVAHQRSKSRATIPRMTFQNLQSSSDTTSSSVQTLYIYSAAKPNKEDPNSFGPTCMSSIPVFSLSCALNQTLAECDINSPLSGLITIQNSDTPISRIEIQLTLIENVSKDIYDLNETHFQFPPSTSLCGYKTTNIMRKSRSSILDLEVVHGNVVHQTPIPICIRIPRLKVCTTFISDFFCVEFEFSLIVSFEGGYVVRESFPISFCRRE